jgi:hypothetical protein
MVPAEKKFKKRQLHESYLLGQYDKIVQTITGFKNKQKLTNISTWGSFLVAYASSSVRGSNNKLSAVVKGPDAIICFRTKSMCKLSRGIKRLRKTLKRCHHSIY